MAGTNIAAGRAALITALRALEATTLAGAKVDYSYVAATHEGNREYIHGGWSSDGTMSLGTMRGGVRHSRDESVSWTLTVHVTGPGQRDTAATDVRAAALGGAVEDHIAANPQLGGLAGLLKLTVAGLSLTSWVDEHAAHSVLTYSLAFDSYLE